VALLGSYLLFKQWQRDRQRFGPSNPADWTGKGIDVTSMKPTLEEVRRSYPRPAARGVCFHRHVLHIARGVVGDMRYFQEREGEEREDFHACRGR